MTRLTYSEQLRHPMWQRVRLERLSAAGWRCQSCGDAETTLHVHHRRYIKGRMAWEYPADNFVVLCDPCHQEAHVQQDGLMALLAAIPLHMTEEAAALLSGYFSLDLDPLLAAAFCERDLYTHNVGYTARSMAAARLSIECVADLSNAFSTPTWVHLLKALVQQNTADFDARIQRDINEERHKEGST